MEFNDLLKRHEIDPATVILMRHRPYEPNLARVMPMLAFERPELFNGYQRAQGEREMKMMQRLIGKGYLASFIANGPGQALFIGLYAVSGARPVTFDQFWAMPENVELKALGMSAGEWEKPETLWFELDYQDSFYSDWKGCLVVEWPGLERSWVRRAHNQSYNVLAVHAESALAPVVPDWRSINLSWAELRLLPAAWRAQLSAWRAIYFIFDTADGKGYVGSAYGVENLLGRWLNYSASGHGGNKYLRGRLPDGFQFTILERLSPDMEADDVIRRENTWKERLHTRHPWGLNDN